MAQTTDFMNGNYTETKAKTLGWVEDKVVESQYVSVLDNYYNEAINYFTRKNTLQGVDGDIIKITTHTYDATIVDGDTGIMISDDDMGKLYSAEKQIEVKAKKSAFKLTDKQYRRGIEGGQDLVSLHVQGQADGITDFIDDSVHEAMKSITREFSYTSLNYDAIQDALGKLKIKNYDNMFIMMSDNDFIQLKKNIRKDVLNTNAGAELTIRGNFILVDGLTIVRDYKLTDGTSYILSSDTIVYETKVSPYTVRVDRPLDEDIVWQTKFVGLCYVATEKKAIKLVKAGA